MSEFDLVTLLSKLLKKTYVEDYERIDIWDHSDSDSSLRFRIRSDEFTIRVTKHN